MKMIPSDHRIRVDHGQPMPPVVERSGDRAIAI